MDQSKKNILNAKIHQNQLKLHAREFVKRKITYHWLEIFDAIKAANIEHSIEYLCNVNSESYNYFIDAIKELNRSEFSNDLIKINEPSMMDNLFDKYPSIDSFKYIMNLPVIASSKYDFNSLIKESNQLPNFYGDTVYFLSPDWSPLIRLNWKDVVDKGGDIFNQIPVTFIFTNSKHTKILFKSLEDEFRILEI